MSRALVASNTLGLSNSISNLLESVANCNEGGFESISGEDMLSTIKESDRKVPEIRKKWEARRNKKMEIDCENCKIEAVMSKCSRGDHKQLEHSNKKGIEAGIGMLHPEGTQINSKESTWLACPGPKGLASKK